MIFYILLLFTFSSRESPQVIISFFVGIILNSYNILH